MKQLTKEEMKQVKGGTSEELRPCFNPAEDCGPFVCVGNIPEGYICVNYVCKWAVCA